MLEETFVQRVKFAQLPIFYDKNIFKKKNWLGVGLGVRVVVNKIKWRKEKKNKNRPMIRVRCISDSKN